MSIEGSSHITCLVSGDEVVFNKMKPIHSGLNTYNFPLYSTFVIRYNL